MWGSSGRIKIITDETINKYLLTTIYPDFIVFCIFCQTQLILPIKASL